MLRRGVWGLAATLALALAVRPARAQDSKDKEETPAKPSPGWWSRVTGRPTKPVVDEDEEEAKNEKKQKEAARKARDAELAREQRMKEAAARAEEDYLRRERVLDRIAQLAQGSNDPEAILRQVERLTERAWKICQDRTGVPHSSAPARKRETNVGGRSR
jgi:hypothetical protein